MAKRCAKCGQENPDWASFCQRCGEYFRGAPSPGATAAPAPGPGGATPTPGAPGQAPAYGFPAPQYPAGTRPLLGATLVLILAGLITAATVLISVYLQVTGAVTVTGEVSAFDLWLTYIGLVVMPLPIVAGLLAWKRSAWGLAVGCAALGLMTAFDSFYFVSGVLCLIGLIYLVRRRSLFIS